MGALTLNEFRFKTRVWYLANTATICAGCARGCNVVVGVGKQQTLMTTRGQLDDRVKRIVPRVNEEVNGWWICDEGRLSYEHEQKAPRLEAARVAGKETAYDDAVKAAATKLAAAAKAGALGVIVSPRLVSEDVFAWKSVVSALGGGAFGVRSLLRGEDDTLLIRADKGANAQGAAWILGAGATERAVREAVAQGRVKTLLILGDPLDAGDSAIVEAPAGSGPEVVYCGPFASPSAARASVAVPCASWSEADGTYVNFEGRAQRVRRCHLPQGEARPGWRVAADLAEAAGAAATGWSSAAEVLAALGRAIKEFEGISFEAMGLLGLKAPVAAGV